MELFNYQTEILKKFKNIKFNVVISYNEGLLINSNKNGFVRKSYIKNYLDKYGLQPIFLTNDVDLIYEERRFN